MARRAGGVLVRLKAEWSAIVGAETAAVSWPEALGRDGALKLRTAPAAALDLQHRAPLVAERINNFFGRNVVMRLALVQAPLPIPTPRPGKQVPALSVAGEQRLAAQLSDIADPELQKALAGLGRLLLSRDNNA